MGQSRPENSSRPPRIRPETKPGEPRSGGPMTAFRTYRTRAAAARGFEDQAGNVDRASRVTLPASRGWGGWRAGGLGDWATGRPDGGTRLRRRAGNPEGAWPRSMEKGKVPCSRAPRPFRGCRRRRRVGREAAPAPRQALDIRASVDGHPRPPASERGIVGRISDRTPGTSERIHRSHRPSAPRRR